MDKLRIDKWLWAARFYKTRSIAKTAIEGGKVHHQGSRVKVSKEVSVGMVLKIRQGSATAGSEKEVVVTQLSDKRGSAADAVLLYEETAQSIQRREDYAQNRKLANLARPEHKPTKKQRRKLKAFQQHAEQRYLSDDEGY